MAGKPSAAIRVEVVYARPEQQAVVELELAPGATLADAIRGSGLLERFPEIDLGRADVGVHGRRVTLDALLRPGDRVEIYRPLLANPKEMRRQRAKGVPARRR